MRWNYSYFGVTFCFELIPNKMLRLRFCCHVYMRGNGFWGVPCFSAITCWVHCYNWLQDESRCIMVPCHRFPLYFFSWPEVVNFRRRNFLQRGIITIGKAMWNVHTGYFEFKLWETHGVYLLLRAELLIRMNYSPNFHIHRHINILPLVKGCSQARPQSFSNSTYDTWSDALCALWLINSFVFVCNEFDVGYVIDVIRGKPAVNPAWRSYENEDYRQRWRRITVAKQNTDSYEPLGIHLLDSVRLWSEGINFRNLFPKKRSSTFFSPNSDLSVKIFSDFHCTTPTPLRYYFLNYRVSEMCSAEHFTV